MTDRTIYPSYWHPASKREELGVEEGKDYWVTWSPEFSKADTKIPSKDFEPVLAEYDPKTNLWIHHWEHLGDDIEPSPVPMNPQPEFFCLGFRPESPIYVDKATQPEEVKVSDRTLGEWRELAREDICLDIIFPSDLRMLLGQIDKFK